jgi:hypothetical protein
MIAFERFTRELSHAPGIFALSQRADISTDMHHSPAVLLFATPPAVEDSCGGEAVRH